MKRIFSIVLLLALLLFITSCKTTEPNVITSDPIDVEVAVPDVVTVDPIVFPYWDIKPVFDIESLLPSTDTSNVVENNLTLIAYQMKLELYLRFVQTFFEGGEWEPMLLEYKLE